MPATNLLPQRTSFVARERELASLRALLRSGSQHVTITGPGGVGKTRLALRVGELAVEDGWSVWFADLSEAFDAGAIAATIARSLGLARVGDDPVPTIVDALGPDTLLVLDNCEQAVDAVAAVLGRIRDGARETKYLATSRERLHIAGEQLFPLDPLLIDEACQLFVERARSVNPAWSPSSMEHVAQITRAVDGLPLGIELAAARVTIFSERALLDELSDSLRLLSSGPRDVPGRQRDLAAAVAWSWQLLSADEQHALACCAQFRGGFTMELAARVLERSDVVDIIASLRDKSLIRTYEPLPGRLRFGLYETIRVFARDKLTTETNFADAVLAVTAGYAERVNGPDGVEAVESLGLELLNLVEVHARGVQRADANRALRAVEFAAPFLDLRGPTDLFFRMLDGALSCEGGDPPVRARVLVDRGTARYRAGRAPAARADLDEALTIADPRTTARAARMLGRMAAESGDAPSARSWFERGLSLLADENDILLALLRADLGAGLAQQGDFARGQALIEAALATLSEHGSPAHRGLIRMNYAVVLSMQDRMNEAREHFERALPDLRRMRADRWVAWTLDNLGHLHQVTGDFTAARACFDEALACYRRLGEHFALATCQANAAGLEHELGNYNAACALYDAALEVMQRAERWPRAATLLSGRGAANAARGRLDDARADFARARTIGEKITNEVTTPVIRLWEAQLDLAEGDVKRAMQALEGGRGIVAGHDDARLPFKLLTKALEGELTAFVIAESGAWFRAPGTEVVDLRRRQSLRRIVAALARNHVEGGKPLLIEDLVQAGWPGEKMKPAAGATRAYTALTTLRNLGLRDVLHSERGSHSLVGALTIAREE